MKTTPKKALQRTLPLRDARYVAPAMTVETARGILGMDEDEVAEAVELGELVAWDIASDGSERRELRLFTPSVSALARARAEQRDVFPPDCREAVAALLPEKPWITGRELARALCCSGTHICSLVECGDLALMPGTKITRGKEGTPRITKESLTAFLRGRLEGGYVE